MRGSDMYEAMGIVGANAGFKELLSHTNVSERVKAAVRNVLLCYSNVVGTNAARTTERHTCNSYCLLFGTPLAFTTANFADVTQPMMKLLYDTGGATTTECSWSLLEEHDPEMPSKRDMCRMVAADPVMQAVFLLS